MKFPTISLFLVLAFSFVESSVKYTPDWPSLDSRPSPDWFDEAKIGIFMHFGVYSVPAFGSEWFWYSLMSNASEYVKFMENNYPPDFTYQDFGPLLTMESFEASKFADIIADSGAKYLVFTSKHHEGFANWPSSYSYSWNSMDIGPKRNVLGELKEALANKDPDIRFGLYYSLFEWFNPIYLKDKANNFNTREYVLNKMIPEMKELVETFEPSIYWSDGDGEALPEYFGSEEFLAWLYNESPVKDFVVTNDRWGVGCEMTHGGFWSGPDRYSPGVLIHHKWESAMTIDKQSWGYRRDIDIEDILTPEEILSLLVSTVSCGGNILINVGPTKEGTIIPIFQERLKQMGTWLKTNGEAIYSTVPWVHQNDSLATLTPVWYTSGKDSLSNYTYAMAVGWPKDETLLLGSTVAVEDETTIEFLGLENEFLNFEQTEEGLRINFPPQTKVISECGQGCQWVYVIKMLNVEAKVTDNKKLLI